MNIAADANNFPAISSHFNSAYKLQPPPRCPAFKRSSRRVMARSECPSSSVIVYGSTPVIAKREAPVMEPDVLAFGSHQEHASFHRWLLAGSEQGLHRVIRIDRKPIIPPGCPRELLRISNCDAESWCKSPPIRAAPRAGIAASRRSGFVRARCMPRDEASDQLGKVPPLH